MSIDIDFELTDNNVINFLTDKSGHANAARLSIKFLNSHPRLKDFLDSRYEYFDSYAEVYYRLKHDISMRPVCLHCGKPVKFIGSDKGGFQTYCCNKCAKLDETYQMHYKQTCLQNLGVDNPFKSKAVRDKSAQTMKSKFGHEYPLQNEICRQNLINTCRQRYNTDNGGASVQSLQKRQETCQSRYSADSYIETPEFRQQRKEKMIQKFGTEHPIQNPELKDKINQTCLEIFGTMHPAQNPDIKEKTSQTCQIKYGVKWFIQTDECQEKAHSLESMEKSIQTKRENKTFNSSEIENRLIAYFEASHINYQYQHKSTRYPYNCDFYFPNIDLYLEIQGTWTHGKHPFNPDDPDDRHMLEFMKEKSMTSNYYKTAINVWTNTDVKKRNIAKINNLNYIEIFSDKVDYAIKTLNEKFPDVFPI